MNHYKHQGEAFITVKAKELMFFMKKFVETVKAFETFALPIYKIIDWIEIDNVGYCVVLVTGTKGLTEKFTPAEILVNDDLLRKFDQKDIVTITNFNNYEKLKPKAKVCSVDCDTNSIMIKGLDGKEENYALKDIKNNSSFFENLSKKDIFHIARIIGQADTEL